MTETPTGAGAAASAPEPHSTPPSAPTPPAPMGAEPTSSPTPPGPLPAPSSTPPAPTPAPVAADWWRAQPSPAAPAPAAQATPSGRAATPSPASRPAGLTPSGKVPTAPAPGQGSRPPLAPLAPLAPHGAPSAPARPVAPLPSRAAPLPPAPMAPPPLPPGSLPPLPPLPAAPAPLGAPAPAAPASPTPSSARRAAHGHAPSPTPSEKRRAHPRGRAPGGPAQKQAALLKLVVVFIGLTIVGLAIVLMVVLGSKHDDASSPGASPSPVARVEPSPTPVPSTAPAPERTPRNSAALDEADRAIARARELDGAGKPEEARAVLEAALHDPRVKEHELARSLVRDELAALVKRELAKRDEPPASTDADASDAKPSPSPEPTPDMNGGDTPADTGKPDASSDEGKSEPAKLDPRSRVRRARALAAALDFEGALAALADLEDALAKPVRDEIAARTAYLDALGATLAPGTSIIIDESGRKGSVAKADSLGVAIAEKPVAIPWDRLPRATVFELVTANDKTVSGAPLGVALVLYDLGLWQKGDARLKAWIDQDPDAQAPAFAELAARRGLEAPPAGGFVWRGEWLTPDEQARLGRDQVRVEGKLLSRDDARKLVDRRQKERRPSKKAKTDAARARAEQLERDFGVTDIRTIVDSGDPAKRADIVLVSDGYSAQDEAKFDRIAANVAKTVLTIEPFRSYARYVNVHRITVLEAQSGIGAGKATRLGSRVSAGILACDSSAARRYGALAPDADLVMVCANVQDVRSTGAPGRPGVITLEATGDFNDVALHELGHAFADLDDEYVDPQSAADFPDYGPDEELRHVNTTRVKDARLAKWHYWMLPPLPGEMRIDCFEGGYYRDKGYYRPARACRMSDRECRRYCAVCLEQLEKSFYQRLEPIDDASPRTPEVTLWKDETGHFEATVIAIEASEKFGSFAAKWYVDGKPTGLARSAGIKTQLDLQAGPLAPGEHSVALRVDFKDDRVRRDDGVLSSSRAWRVRVLESPKPKLSVPDRVTLRRGEVATVDVTLDASQDLALAADGPPGSLFASAGKHGRFTWAPPREARGEFRVRFTAGTGSATVERATLVDIQDDAHDVGPVLSDPGAVHAIRGQPLEVALEAQDWDGDALVFTATKKLPPGAELDPVRGVFKWTPSFSDPFASEVEIGVRVSDGKLTDELAFKVTVENRVVDGPRAGFDELCATRSPDPAVRLAAVQALAASDLPLDAKLLELARLLRDHEPEIARAALEGLRGLPGREGSGESALASRRDMLAIDLAEHVWDFTDRREVRALLAEVAKGSFEGEARAAAARMTKELAAVEKYDRDRGAP